MNTLAVAVVLASCGLVAGADYSLWQPIKPVGNYKCHLYSCDSNPSGCTTVKSQAECQANAVKKGVKYYSYRASDKKCTSSDECKKPDATYPDWKAFSATAMWPVWNYQGKEARTKGTPESANWKCHKSCKIDGCEVVADLKACQDRAIKKGHMFYSYMKSEKKCASSLAWEKPDETYANRDWKCYRYLNLDGMPAKKKTDEL
jgi:hypothetical protein